MAVDVGEAEAATLEGMGEAGVVDAELVENSGVEVVDVHGGRSFAVFGWFCYGIAIGIHDVVAVVVGRIRR